MTNISEQMSTPERPSPEPGYVPSVYARGYVAELEACVRREYEAITAIENRIDGLRLAIDVAKNTWGLV